MLVIFRWPLLGACWTYDEVGGLRHGVTEVRHQDFCNALSIRPSPGRVAGRQNGGNTCERLGHEDRLGQVRQGVNLASSVFLVLPLTSPGFVSHSHAGPPRS